MRRQQRGFTLIELMVGSAVTFVTVLAVSAAFLGYTQSFYTQAGIRGGQAALRQTHQMVVRNLRMAGYGMDPPNVFSFPERWSRTSTDAINRSDRLVFRMRNPAFNAIASPILGGAAVSTITITKGLAEPLSKGQILQVVCAGGLSWTYVQLSVKAAIGATQLQLEPQMLGADGKPVFPRLNEFSKPCFGSGAGTLGVNVFKIDVYDYSIRLIDDDGNPGTPGKPYLFRKHGLDEKTTDDPYGEPVAEDIEAMRVTFLRGDGKPFVPALDTDTTQPPPSYDTLLDDPLRRNNNRANIRAVVVGLVARSATRDSGSSPIMMNDIPSFGIREDGAPEPPILNAPYGFRRFVSETTVQVRNMRSSELPVPVYYKQDVSKPGACNGTLPEDDLNCAGG